MTIEKFVNINWYMERKPYKVHTSYDVFYLNICRELYQIIHKTALGYEDAVALETEDVRELAYVLTAYFEDVTNNYGFWQSLVNLHRKQFNKRLPFFDKQYLQELEEEYDDVNPADIHYLLFVTYYNLMSGGEEKTMVYFHKDFFLEATEEVLVYFSGIEEVLTTEFYEKFLVPDKDYIDFKLKLDWFTFKSYLTGLEFSDKLEEISWSLLDSNADEALLGPALYAETDRLLFEVPSSLSAFFPLDIFAGALHCSEQKKQETGKLKLRAHGIFHIQNETPTHFRFLHTATGEEFNVLKNSFNHVPDPSKDEEYWITTLASWDGDYYISGLCLPCPYKGEEIYRRNLGMQDRFQNHFPPYRKQIEEMALQYRNAAQQFFGSELIVYETGKELNEKLDEFSLWYFNNVTDQSKISADARPAQLQLPKELLTAKNVALFIQPKDGFEFITAHLPLLQILQTNEPNNVSREEIELVLPLLLGEGGNTDYWYYLRKHFALPNLSLFFRCPAEKQEDFDAALRLYQPESFSPLKLPRFKTFTSERMSTSEAKEIFSRKE